MQRISLSHAAAVLALAALAACDSPIEAPRQQPEDLSAMVEALGFRGDMVEDFGDYVVVEGDIRIPKSQLQAARPRSAGDAMSPRFQYRTTALVGSTTVSQITVSLAGLAAEPNWQNAARTAIGLWSQIPNSYIRIVEAAPGAPADITFVLGCLPWNWAAEASWPSGGNPGQTITVNQAGCIGFGQNNQQRLHNMVHEIGHTLGFRHTNWQARGEGAGTEGAVHVPGTPTGNDNGSVMNGGTASSSWAGFSAADLLAARTLYPLPAPPSLTASYPGGMEVLAWSPVTGATSYEVRYTEYREVNDSLWGYSYNIYPGTWSSVTGTSFTTGRPLTGAWYCMWEETETRTDRSHYLWEVRARFPTGASEVAWTLSETATC